MFVSYSCLQEIEEQEIEETEENIQQTERRGKTRTRGRGGDRGMVVPVAMVHLHLPPVVVVISILC